MGYQYPGFFGLSYRHLILTILKNAQFTITCATRSNTGVLMHGLSNYLLITLKSKSGTERYLFLVCELGTGVPTEEPGIMTRHSQGFG